MLTMMNKLRRQEKGDTLIEVLFAVTVFSFIVVTALSLMNQGVAASQRSLEITTVRQQMDGQAETLRFLHSSYVQAYQPGRALTAGSPAAEYGRIVSFAQTGGRTSASSFGGLARCAIPNNTATDFILNPVSATMVTNATRSGVFQAAPTFAQLEFGPNNVLTRSQGLWIEPVRSPSNGTSAGFIDFHIRACWDVPGADNPMNLGTIVRLYEPRG
jgi:type II secretory pathway pseudopilin PulG